MSNSDEIRWQQRLENFSKAMKQLDEACDLIEYSDLERAGLVQTFEFSFELAWNVLKDLLFYEGHDMKSPRDVIRKSFEMDYISEDECETFLDALEKRNILSHTYNDDTAHEAEEIIKEEYHPLLSSIHSMLERKRNA